MRYLSRVFHHDPCVLPVFCAYIYMAMINADMDQKANRRGVQASRPRSFRRLQRSHVHPASPSINWNWSYNRTTKVVCFPYSSVVYILGQSMIKGQERRIYVLPNSMIQLPLLSVTTLAISLSNGILRSRIPANINHYAPDRTQLKDPFKYWYTISSPVFLCVNYNQGPTGS